MVYRPPSQRKSRPPLKGVITFCGIIAAIIAFIAFVFYDYHQPEPAVDIPISKPVIEKKADNTDLGRENERRKQDARAAVYAGGDFYRANANAYPTAYAKGMLSGAPGTKPQAVALTHYKELLIASGVQKPILDDTIRFVADAACAPSGSATVASAQTYAYVVQYAIKTPEGAFSAQCLKL